MKKLKYKQRGILILEKNSLSTDILEKKVDRFTKTNTLLKTNHKGLTGRILTAGEKVGALKVLMKRVLVNRRLLRISINIPPKIIFVNSVCLS